MAKLSATVQRMDATAHPLQGKTKFAGMSICIENKKGTTRSGVGADGKPWSVRMPFDYGYIRKTKGPDGDAYDCFIGPNPSSKFAYVVHQCKQLDKNKWDEDKVMLGFDSADAAIRAYKSAYNNVDLFHSMTVMPMATFKTKVAATRTTKRHVRLHAGGPGSGRHKSSLSEWEQIIEDNKNNKPTTIKEPVSKLASALGAYSESSPKKLLSGIKALQENTNHPLSKALSRLAKESQAMHTGKSVKLYRAEIDSGLKKYGSAGNIAKSYSLTKEGAEYFLKSFAAEFPIKSYKITSADVPTNRIVMDYRHPDAQVTDSREQEILVSTKPLHTISAVMDYMGDVGYDYRQFREGTAIQPLTNKHPPSLKNPMPTPSDNPDDIEDNYKDRKKRRAKTTKRFYKELARRQPDKPELVNTTQFIPINQG